MFFDPVYFLFIGPAILLGFWAQWRVKSTFADASGVGARMTGAEVARRILDASGLYQVGIEQVPGQLTDHYDPTAKVLRLSPQVYGARSAAAIGIAAHEAGHALQDAKKYLPLVVRNAAVPAANFGSGISWGLMMLGFLMSAKFLVWLGVIAFTGVVFFQLVNLPVEFDASWRAKRLLSDMGMAGSLEQSHVNRVLNAAALTYVAATLQSALTLAYSLFRFAGAGDE
jgi:Zn-dependent membrane protease YugP